MTVQQVKALRKLQPQGLDDVAIKVLSDGLRSEGLGVVEAALDVCAAHTGGATAAPLSHAWPRAPAAALPMMAAALVEAAKRSDDGLRKAQHIAKLLKRWRPGSISIRRQPVLKFTTTATSRAPMRLAV